MHCTPRPTQIDLTTAHKHFWTKIQYEKFQITTVQRYQGVRAKKVVHVSKEALRPISLSPLNTFFKSGWLSD